MIETQIKKKFNHDSMWINVNFPSGGNFKFTVNRYKETLELAFSNDDPEQKIQMYIFKKWMKTNHTTSWGELFNKLEDLSKTCKSGKELINLMVK